MRNFSSVTSGIIIGSSLLIASSAIAGGFAIREQSTTGLGLAFADSAAGSDLSSMFWNPAAVTSQDGLNSLSSFSLIAPDTDITPTSGTGTNKDDLGLLGASYYNYQINQQLYVGLSVNSPLGLVTTADPKSWAGEEHFQKSEMLTINASPTIGYKLNPMLSMAVGLQIEYMKVRLQSKHPTFTTDTITKGDDIAVGFTFGVLMEPASGTKIGIGFRSSIKHKLEGKLIGISPLDPVRNISAVFETPEMVTASIRQEITPDFVIMANYEWTNWSRLQEFVLINKADGASTGGTVYNWTDGWYTSVGAEMKLNEKFTGRMGVGYEKSPVPNSTRGPGLPDSDRVWLSFGGSYKWSESTMIDFGYSHVFFKDADINLADEVTAAGLKNGINADVDNRADIISVGLRSKW